jgi:hypothetical protein
LLTKKGKFHSGNLTQSLKNIPFEIFYTKFDPKITKSLLKTVNVPVMIWICSLCIFSVLHVPHSLSFIKYRKMYILSRTEKKLTRFSYDWLQSPGKNWWKNLRAKNQIRVCEFSKKTGPPKKAISTFLHL